MANLKEKVEAFNDISDILGGLTIADAREVIDYASETLKMIEDEMLKDLPQKAVESDNKKTSDEDKATEDFIKSMYDALLRDI